jgi:hypothetical protein
VRVNWKGVSIFLLFALAVSCLVLGYVYTIGQQRVGNITYQKIQGDKTEHLTTFEVMIEPGVDADKVYRALMLCPNAYGYTLVTYDEDRLMASPWYVPAPFPKDNEDWLIVVADGDIYEADVAGWTVQYTGRIVVLDLDEYPDIILASIITHECTHQFEKGRLDFYNNNMGVYSLWIYDEWIGYYPKLGENGWKALYNLYILDEYLNTNS